MIRTGVGQFLSAILSFNWTNEKIHKTYQEIRYLCRNSKEAPSEHVSTSLLLWPNYSVVNTKICSVTPNPPHIHPKCHYPLGPQEIKNPEGRVTSIGIQLTLTHENLSTKADIFSSWCTHTPTRYRSKMSFP